MARKPDPILARTRWIGRPELRRLLRAARANPRVHLLFVLCANLGLRVGEVVALEVQDFLENRSVIVRTEKQGEPVEDAVSCPLSVFRLAQGFIRKHELGPARRVIGRTERWAQGQFDRYAREAGIKVEARGGRKGRGIHCLRHFFGFEATKATGGNPAQVAALLRHRRPGSAEIYMHTSGVNAARQKMRPIT